MVKQNSMKIFTSVVVAIFLGMGVISCGQAVPPQQRDNIAANFSKGKEAGILSKYSQATFAAGCFWHEETLFESLKGVKEVVSGYSGGTTANPTYEDIETGATGHAETVNIYYDSSVITFPMLLKTYFEAMESPTQVNGQGPDHGTQYRSIIFFRNEKERSLSEQMVKKLNDSGGYGAPIAATVQPMVKFWEAEGYHQDYINTHTDNPYVYSVSIPGIARFQAKHPEMVKPGRNFATGR